MRVLAGQSFSHIFGATTSATESLLVKRRLMGPGWLKISNVNEDNSKVRAQRQCITAITDATAVQRCLR